MTYFKAGRHFSRMSIAWSSSCSEMISGGARRTTSPFPAVRIKSPCSRAAETNGDAGTSSWTPTRRPLPRTSFTCGLLPSLFTSCLLRCSPLDATLCKKPGACPHQLVEVSNEEMISRDITYWKHVKKPDCKKQPTFKTKHRDKVPTAVETL